MRRTYVNTLITSFLQALSTWPDAHAYATQFYAEQMRKWNDEGERDPTIYRDKGVTQERWMQILNSLREAVASWDTASYTKGGYSTSKGKYDGQHHENTSDSDLFDSEDGANDLEEFEHEKIYGENFELESTPDEELEEVKNSLVKRAHMRLEDEAGLRKVDEIFNLSPEKFALLKRRKLCYGCGEKHLVFKCSKTNQASKDEYDALIQHARNKEG